MEWYQVLSLVIGLLGALLGVAFMMKFQNAIAVLAELRVALQKAGELFIKASEALKDRKVTKSEAVLLLKAWQEAYSEFSDVYSTLRKLLPASVIKFLFRR